MTDKEPWDEAPNEIPGPVTITPAITQTGVKAQVEHLLNVYELLEDDMIVQQAKLQSRIDGITDPVKSQIEALQHSIDDLLAPYLPLVQSAQKEAEATLAKLRVEADSVKSQVEAMAGQIDTSVHGTRYYAEYHKPTVKFDKDMLLGFAKAHPEVMGCSVPVPASFVIKRKRK